MATRLLASSILFLLACTTARSMEAPHASVRTPLSAKWIARAASGGTLDLTARITFNTPLKEPVTVSVKLPPGVVLVGGQQVVQVVSPSSGGAVDLDYSFILQGRVTGTLVLTADLETPAFGVHAKDVYAVGGRATPPQRARGAPATGPGVKLNGKDMGPSTPIR